MNFPTLPFATSFWRLVSGCLVFLSLSSAVVAASSQPTPRFELVSTVGEIGIRQREPADTIASLELRFPLNWHGIRPLFGISSMDNGTWFSGAGFVYDYHVTPSWTATVGTGPFYYKSHDRDLGLDLEFYSFFEITHRIWHEDRVGMRIGHLSNGGLGRRNPGTEDLLIVAVFPLGR